MNALQQIFTVHADEYLAVYGDTMPRAHKKVIRAIRNCRSGSLGMTVYRCDDCGNQHLVPCSCGNRHCPTCQHQKADRWLLRELERLLPCRYFLITYTLPEGLRRFIRSHQDACYRALFSASSQALKKLAADHRFLGTDKIGALAVLHTWGGTLQYHPHIHYVVPGGGLSEQGTEWRPARQDLFVHVLPLSKLFRGTFRDAMKTAGLLDGIDQAVWTQDWVVHAKAVGSGQTALRYLARYLFRVAISNSRIISVKDRIVTFRYKDKDHDDDSARWRTMSLDVMEFIRRYLQHVLPHGFMKVRHYGFLNHNFGLALDRIRELVYACCQVVADFFPVSQPLPLPVAPPRCPCCGGKLRAVAFWPAPKGVSTG
jgi:hypothetical protein